MKKREPELKKLINEGYLLLDEKIRRVSQNKKEESRRLKPLGVPAIRVEEMLKEALGNKKWEDLSPEEKKEVRRRFIRLIISYYLRPEAWIDKTVQETRPPWIREVIVAPKFVIRIYEWPEWQDASFSILGFDKKRKKKVVQIYKSPKIDTESLVEVIKAICSLCEEAP